MTEPAESPAEPARATEPRLHRNDYQAPSRLGQVAAVVAIVAGVVFVVAVVFFTGFVLGGNWGGYGHDGWRHSGQMGPGGKPGTCPIMGGDGMMGPGQMGPGQMGPGGMMGPGPSPTTTATSTPRP